MQPQPAVKVSLNALVQSLEMASDDLETFLNPHTGEIKIVGDGADDEESIDDSWILLPDKYDVDEYSIMEDFCYAIENPEMQLSLLNAIEGKGAFGRFKTGIHSFNLQHEWTKFREQRLKEVAIEFCEVHHLSYEDDT